MEIKEEYHPGEEERWKSTAVFNLYTASVISSVAKNVWVIIIMVVTLCVVCFQKGEPEHQREERCLLQDKSFQGIAHPQVFLLLKRKRLTVCL